MDNLCHTLVGAALGEAGLKRRTRFGMAALLVGANLPDIDVLSLFAPDPAGLGFRRGITHGAPALVAMPFLLTAALWACDRLWRSRKPRNGPPFDPANALLLSSVAILTHPFLDFLNVYGMRWLMPLSGRWWYGDTLFIVDVWMWIALGLGVWLSRRAGRRGGDGRPGAGGDRHPGGGDAHPGGRGNGHPGGGEKGRAAARPYGGFYGGFHARVALLAVGAYIVVMAGANVVARRIVRRDLVAAGVPEPAHLMVGPAPLTPFAREVVASAGDRIWRGSFDWRRDPRVVLTSAVAGEDTRARASAARAAAETPAGRTYLGWARFPTFEIEWTGTCRVLLGDARYHQASWAQARVDVNLPREECR